jgi:phosphoribosyl 1,2-cyclic phosphodiesterase
MALKILCRGARGSVPVSGPQFRRYGGATTCFEIEFEGDHRLLIDAGTGALAINQEVRDRPTRFTVLLTHLHWDHTLALPFFAPLYNPQNCFDFYGHTPAGMGIEDALEAVMQPPWFPVSFKSAASAKNFHHLDGTTFSVGDISISHAKLFHPQGVTGYRLERDGVVLVIATDVEHGEPGSDEALLELASGADLLVYDAQYHPEEYLSLRKGWGHSTWEAGVTLANRAQVKRLLLTSHDPARTDDQIDEIVVRAREFFPATEAATEGMVIEI